MWPVSRAGPGARLPSGKASDMPGSTPLFSSPFWRKFWDSQFVPQVKCLLCPSVPKPSRCALSSQVLGIHLNKWRLDRKLGVYVLVLYAVFLCFSIMIEFNVFTFVNLPMCREDD